MTLYSLHKSPTQERAKASVEALLQAATQLLLSIGYDKSSTNKIALRAGVSIGTLYDYFPGKEAIFAEIQRRENQRHYDLLMAAPFPETLSDMLRLHVLTYIEFIQSNLKLHRALIKEVPRFAVVEVEAAIVKKYISLSNAFMLSKKNELRPQHNIDIIAELLTRTIKATINEYALNAPERLEDSIMTNELIDMFERYILRYK